MATVAKPSTMFRRAARRILNCCRLARALSPQKRKLYYWRPRPHISPFLLSFLGLVSFNKKREVRVKEFARVCVAGDQNPHTDTRVLIDDGRSTGKECAQNTKIQLNKSALHTHTHTHSHTHTRTHAQGKRECVRSRVRVCVYQVPLEYHLAQKCVCESVWSRTTRRRPHLSAIWDRLSDSRDANKQTNKRRKERNTQRVIIILAPVIRLPSCSHCCCSCCLPTKKEKAFVGRVGTFFSDSLWCDAL